jgi:hypothetical protein
MDDEVSVVASPVRPTHPQHIEPPRLLFRCYSDESQGLNTVVLIRAGQFEMSPNPVPPPADPNSARFYHDASTHLTPHEIATPFISISSSLVWAIQMAVHKGSENYKNIAIAVIDGPLAHMHTRMYSSREVLRQLRRRGEYANKKTR